MLLERIYATQKGKKKGFSVILKKIRKLHHESVLNEVPPQTEEVESLPIKKMQPRVTHIERELHALGLTVLKIDSLSSFN